MRGGRWSMGWGWSSGGMTRRGAAVLRCGCVAGRDGMAAVIALFVRRMQGFSPWYMTEVTYLGFGR